MITSALSVFYVSNVTRYSKRPEIRKEEVLCVSIQAIWVGLFFLCEIIQCSAKVDWYTNIKLF